MKFYFFLKLLNIKLLYELIVLGIEIAFYFNSNNLNSDIVDKAKPRAIVGRKATGPSGIAGLPKLQTSCRNRIALALSKRESGFCFQGAYPVGDRGNMEKSTPTLNPLSSGRRTGVSSIEGIVQSNREEEKIKSETLPEGLDAPRNDLASGETKVGRSPEKSLAQIRRAINEWGATTDSIPGLNGGYLAKLPQSLLISIGCVLVLLVGILNHLAGPEHASPGFYLVPILLVTWLTERCIGFILSVLSALTWLIVDLTSGATYSLSAIPYWNGVKTLSSFFILTIIVSVLKNTLKQEKEISRIDFLTGIRNRRYFIELVNMEINRARRYERPFTMVCLDLDNFKVVNDCFGHSTGDILLRLVARTIQENIRVTDTVARLGGDEFAILMPETGGNVAEVIIQRVQKINLDYMRKHGWPVTLSIGVVTLTSPPSTVDELLRISDRLMYTAKANGKNSIQYEVFGTREWPAVTKD